MKALTRVQQAITLEMPQKPDMSEFLVRVVEYKFNLSCVSYPSIKATLILITGQCVGGIWFCHCYYNFVVRKMASIARNDVYLKLL